MHDAQGGGSDACEHPCDPVLNGTLRALTAWLEGDARQARQVSGAQARAERSSGTGASSARASAPMELPDSLFLVNMHDQAFCKPGKQVDGERGVGGMWGARHVARIAAWLLAARCGGLLHSLCEPALLAPLHQVESLKLGPATSQDLWPCADGPRSAGMHCCTALHPAYGALQAAGGICSVTR